MSLEDVLPAAATPTCQESVAVELSSADEDAGGCSPAERPQEGQGAPPQVLSLRHGAAGDIGSRAEMQDCNIGYDSYAALDAAGHAAANGNEHVNSHAFYGVFDGHGGTAAAHFVRQRLSGRAVAQSCFATNLSSALTAAFLEVDCEYHEQYEQARRQGRGPSTSGTTALVAVIQGDQLVVANAGDSRAVLSTAGKAVDLSSDHKPHTDAERRRIKAAGGTVCPEDRIGGELTVSRAIGDYHLDNLKVCRDGSLGGPLTAAPEVRSHRITAEDEFLLLACDGLWDVASSQAAVTFVAAKLRAHNDPERCAAELVQFALDMESSDNVSVVVVCFSDVLKPKKKPGHSGHGNSMLRRGGRSVSVDGLSRLSDALRPDPSCRRSMSQSGTLPTGFPPLAPQMSSPVQLSPPFAATGQPSSSAPHNEGSACRGSGNPGGSSGGGGAFGRGSSTGTLLTSQGSLSSAMVGQRDPPGRGLTTAPSDAYLADRLRAAAIPETSTVTLTI